MDIADALENYNQYILVEKGLSKQTLINYQYDLKIFFSYFEFKKTTDDLDGTELLEFLNYELSNGNSISTALRRLSSTRSFYVFLKREHYIDFEIPEIESPKKPEHLPNCLTTDEVEALLNAPDLNKPDGIRDRAMLETMYASGMRVSELLALERSKVNINKAVISIFGKGAKERKVPIGDFAIEYIQKYINEVRYKNPGASTKYLFLNRYGKPLSRQYFFKQIKKYTELAGIDVSISPHTLRHCFATHMLDNGAQLKTVQQILGHENISTTEIYTHVTTKRILSAYDLYMRKK